MAAHGTWMYLICILSITQVLSGCAAIERYKCNNKNWQQQGLEDGTDGLVAAEMLTGYGENCTSVGGNVGDAEYMLGYNAGLIVYCTGENGQSVAAIGKIYADVCPVNLEPDFLAGYEVGLEQYCTPDSGYSAGVRANEYLGICPEGSQSSFLSAYLLGLDTAMPQINEKITQLTVEKALVENNISQNQSRTNSISALARKAKKNDNKELEEHYNDQLDELRSRDFEYQSQQSRVNLELRNEKKLRDDVELWRFKWKQALL